MIDIPETRYAKTPDGIHIGYQVLGDGPVDLVYLSSWDHSIDFLLDEPTQVRFFEQLASFCRVILFDKRGTGISDSVSLDAMPTLESWVDDVVAVMDELDSKAASILAVTWTGPLAVLFAATRPDRTSALVLAHTYARLRAAPNYACGRDEDAVEDILSMVEREWGNGPTIWSSYAPSLGSDERLRRWWNRCQRLTLSPASAVAFTRMIADSDVRDVLASIQAPTLVVGGTEPYREARARFLVDHIAGARLLQTTGRDVLPWLNEGLADDLQEFLTGVRPTHETDRVLATVLFTDIVNSTPKQAEVGDSRWKHLLDRHDDLVRRELHRHRGNQVKTTGDGVLATFDGPARAIRCTKAIVDGVGGLGLQARAGLHTGEIEMRADDVTGLAVVIGHRVSALAGPGEVLVSSTVKDLVAGSGILFADRGTHTLKGVPDEWRLFAVES